MLGETDRKLTATLSSLLPLDRLQRIVELGCGGGTLSLWFAGKTSAAVTGVDSSPAAIEEATRRAVQLGAGSVTFRSGSVYDVPLESGLADLVFCRNLMCVVEKPAKVIAEMHRLLGAGGIAVAIEPGSGQNFHDPDDDRFAQLSARLNRAFLKGWAVRGADQNVGMKVPSLFLTAGFTDITVECLQPVYLLCDAKREEEDVIAQLATERAQLTDETITMLLKGGITKSDLREHSVRAQERFSKFSTHRDDIKNSAYLRLLSPLIITLAKSNCRDR